MCSFWVDKVSMRRTLRLKNMLYTLPYKLDVSKRRASVVSNRALVLTALIDNGIIVRSPLRDPA
jgi:hypothetical protein